MFGYKNRWATIGALCLVSIAAAGVSASQPGAHGPVLLASSQAVAPTTRPIQIDLVKAEALRRKFQAVLADARLLDKRTAVQRIEQLKAAQALAAESERLFGNVNGPYGQCAQAGQLQLSLLTELNGIAHALQTGRPVSMLEVGGAANLGHMLGDRSGACRQDLDRLAAARP